MKKFIINISIGVLLLIAIDFVIGTALKHFYFKQSSGLQYRTTYSINKTKAKILVFGSSRANHHYDPNVFETKFNKSFYNTGRDGNYQLYQTAVLQGVLDRYTPELIIYDFAGTFKYDEGDYDRLSALLPYYNSNEEIKQIVNLRSPYEPIKTFSKIYPYNSMLLHIGLGNTEKNKVKNKDIKGFIPLNGNWKNEIDSLKTPAHYEVDSIKLKQFKTFIQLVKSNQIPLYITYSPVYYQYDRDYSIEICKKICLEENIPFYDYSKDEQFIGDKMLFADPDHLNNKGARVFSKIIAEQISKDFPVSIKNELIQN